MHSSTGTWETADMRIRYVGKKPFNLDHTLRGAQCPLTTYEVRSLAFRPSRVGIPSQTRAGQDPTPSADRAPIARHQDFYGARS